MSGAEERTNSNLLNRRRELQTYAPRDSILPHPKSHSPEALSATNTPHLPCLELEAAKVSSPAREWRAEEREQLSVLAEALPPDQTAAVGGAPHLSTGQAGRGGTRQQGSTYAVDGRCASALRR
mmetsp:Transcript_73042/g.145273  ORF Transcript_73042/g.145273 Transcript_73042/m.145273 type:complete len:124 (+) Transcript_73042:532-903(+)